MTRNASTKSLAISVLLVLFLPSTARSVEVPHLELEYLDGAPFVLPADAIGSVTVLVVGFTQAAGANSAPWAARIESQFGSDPSCTTHSVAILAGVPALFRSFAYAAVERNVSASERSTFLLTYDNDAGWKKLVGFSEPNDPYLVVIDRHGDIALTLHGSISKSKYDAVAAQIDMLLSDGNG